jgi:hypothetical protein
MKSITIFKLMSAVGLIGISIVSSYPTHAQTTVRDHRKILGGVNLDAYCKRYHGSRFRAVIVEHRAGGWRCIDVSGKNVGISVQRACEDTYAQRPIKAITVGDGPGDWRCRHNIKSK